MEECRNEKIRSGGIGNEENLLFRYFPTSLCRWINRELEYSSFGAWEVTHSDDKFVNEDIGEENQIVAEALTEIYRDS